MHSTFAAMSVAFSAAGRGAVQTLNMMTAKHGHRVSNGLQKRIITMAGCSCAPDGDIGEARFVVCRPEARGGAHSRGFEHAAAVQDVGQEDRVGHLDLACTCKGGQRPSEHVRI